MLMIRHFLGGGWRRRHLFLGGVMMMMMMIIMIMVGAGEGTNFHQESSFEDLSVKTTRGATASCGVTGSWNSHPADTSLKASHNSTFGTAVSNSSSCSLAIMNNYSISFSTRTTNNMTGSSAAAAAAAAAAAPSSSSAPTLASPRVLGQESTTNSSIQDQGSPAVTANGFFSSPRQPPASTTSSTTTRGSSSSRGAGDDDDDFIPRLIRAWLDWQPEKDPRWETKIIRPGDRVGLHAVRKFLGRVFQEAELGTRFLLDVIPAAERERVAEDIMAFPVFEVVHMGGAALCILYRDEDAPPLVVSAENAGDADSSDSSPNPSPTDQKKKRRLSPDEELQNRLAGCVLVTEHDPSAAKVSGWWQNTRATLVEWWTFVFLWRDTGRPSFEHHPRLYEVDEALYKAESAVHEQYGPQERHAHVRLIGVDPRLQGQGLGRRIMDVVHQVADAAGRPVYLEAVGAGLVRWYHRLGYQSQVVLSVQDPGDAAHELTDFHVLVRPPSPPHSLS